MTRKKTNAILPPATITEAEKVMADYAISVAKMNQINAKMDEEFARIRESNAKELAEHQDRVKSCFSKIQVFAEANPELFNKKKSYPMTQGTIGFRTGTPKVLVQKGFTVKACLALVKAKLPGYVKTKEEIAKDLIIANRDKDEVKANLPEIGLHIVQDETFYVDLKEEALQLN